MYLSKEISSDKNRFIITEKGKISPKEYLSIFEDNKRYKRRSSSEYHKLSFNYFDVENSTTKLFTLELVPIGIIKVFYGQRITDKLIVELNDIAERLGLLILINPSLPYSKSKIIAAQKRLAKKSKVLEIEYQKESFGGNNIWLAIRSSLGEVKKFYELEGGQIPWNEAIENMHACKGMFMYEFRGWTFVAGQKTDVLFGCKVKGEEAVEKCHVDKLLRWGKTFADVQLFMHYNRSTYFNAFYRVQNGELEYGEYYTESYQKNYGKIPKNVKDLPDNNANTVAIEWSYEPDYLRYQKELENAKAWVVNMKQEP